MERAKLRTIAILSGLSLSLGWGVAAPSEAHTTGLNQPSPEAIAPPGRLLTDDEASNSKESIEADSAQTEAITEPGIDADTADVPASESTEPDFSEEAEANTDSERQDSEPQDTSSQESATDEESTEESTAEESTGEESTDETDKPPALTAAERIRRKLLIQADQAYRAGDLETAEALYREAKDGTWLIPVRSLAAVPEPFADPTQLSPAGAVYWREAQAGIENERRSQALVAFNLLNETIPAFIPGHLEHASLLQANGQPEAADAVLEAALTQYPAQPDLLLAQVEAHMAQENWLEAAIASRQFTALNPEHPATPEQTTLAAENLNRFQRATRAELRNGTIANLVTGVLGYAVTGSIFGPFTAANSAILLLQGENAVGNQYANQIQRQLPMLTQPEALGYIRRIGNRLAAATGRDNLDYEFFIILDPNLNAFALPGGKIFINAGAILDTRSEAELAGLMAHELAHSVLSHGFQIATKGNLSSSVAQYLPYGGLINNVFLSGYSRSMERQADIVGTQILAASGYAADGLHNTMITLNEQAEGRGLSWLASHPNPEDRVAYLKTLVERGGYNRYTYEGVEAHEEIQALVALEMAAYTARQRAEREGKE